jgi:broad specificity phosphatase PhoE
MDKNASPIRKLLKIAAKAAGFGGIKAGSVFARRLPPAASGAHGAPRSVARKPDGGVRLGRYFEMGTPAMSRIHMIRHGRPASTWGDSDPDPGLDAVGAEQARAVAQALLALPALERPTRVVSSPLRRCRETAQPLADALGVAVEIDPRVGEIPTPAALSAEARPGWLRQAFQGTWSEIEGDLDYGAWIREVAQGVASYPGAAVFSHFVALNASRWRRSGPTMSR